MSASTASQLATLQAQVTSLTSNNNNYWLIWAGSLAILMQVGFMCLEVGSVRIKNTKNILLKVRTLISRISAVRSVIFLIFGF